VDQHRIVHIRATSRTSKRGGVDSICVNTFALPSQAQMRRNNRRITFQAHIRRCAAADAGEDGLSEDDDERPGIVVMNLLSTSDTGDETEAKMPHPTKSKLIDVTDSDDDWDGDEPWDHFRASTTSSSSTLTVAKTGYRSTSRLGAWSQPPKRWMLGRPPSCTINKEDSGTEDDGDVDEDMSEVAPEVLVPRRRKILRPRGYTRRRQVPPTRWSKGNRWKLPVPYRRMRRQRSPENTSH
jgi:hypothetical protein